MLLLATLAMLVLDLVVHRLYDRELEASRGNPRDSSGVHRNVERVLLCANRFVQSTFDVSMGSRRIARVSGRCRDAELRIYRQNRLMQA